MLFFDFEVSGMNTTSMNYTSVFANSAEYSATMATTNSNSSSIQRYTSVLCSPYSITLQTDSDTYTDFQEIHVNGTIKGPGLVFSDLPGEIKTATIEIRRGDRSLYDVEEAPISANGLYNATIMFFAPPEYNGHQFIIKARYKELAFTEKRFTYYSVKNDAR
jgi:hypothetical protein